MPHFTYEDRPDRSSLLQGDVIKRTKEVDAILQEVHPHYHDSDSYKYFIILTQTCDLVLRAQGGTACKSRYITIAAVRPLKLVVEREIQRILHSRNYDAKLGISDERARSTLTMFLERLLNNNEEDYFYLASDVDAGFRDDHCAFLRLSIALKSDLHYQTLLAAKTLQLRVEFQHKLGYQVGRSYSRVATEDWVPGTLTTAEFNRRISRIVQDNLKSSGVRILEKRMYDRVIKKASEHNELEEASNLLDQFIQEVDQEKKEARAKLFQEIEDVLSKLELDSKAVSSAKVALASNPVFADFVRRAIEIS